MGPRVKMLRRLGTSLPGLSRKTAERRPYPPGARGATARTRKTDYRRQLEEKQKVRFHYGVSETQLRRSLAKATDHKTDPGGTQLERLERRLDNVVFRLGWAPTIPAARQLVVHGHIHVRGRRVDRPGYTVKIGDELMLPERTRRLSTVAEIVERGPEVPLPTHLAWGSNHYTGRVVGQPSRGDVPFDVDEKMVIEFYAR